MGHLSRKHTSSFYKSSGEPCHKTVAWPGGKGRQSGDPAHTGLTTSGEMMFRVWQLLFGQGEERCECHFSICCSPPTPSRTPSSPTLLLSPPASCGGSDQEGRGILPAGSGVWGRVEPAAAPASPRRSGTARVGAARQGRG